MLTKSSDYWHDLIPKFRLENQATHFSQDKNTEVQSMNNDNLQADKINPNIHTPMYIHQVFSMATLTTRIFKNGNSQAVRIPQEFRLDVTQVEISRNNKGDLVIHPLPINRGKALLAALEAFDTDFINQLEQNYQQQPIMQERESL